MEQQNGKSSELSFEALDAVSGGRNATPYECVVEGLKKGFEEAGGTVTCFPADNGMEVCGFKP
jgi:hypothetical protein